MDRHDTGKNQLDNWMLPDVSLNPERGGIRIKLGKLLCKNELISERWIGGKAFGQRGAGGLLDQC